MRALVGSLVVAFPILGLSGCCLPSSIEQMETAYSERLTETNDGIERLPEAERGAFATERDAIVAEYAALPTGDAREAPLGNLNQRLMVLRDRVLAAAEREAERVAAAEQREMTTYRRDFVGNWAGGGMTLSITSDGDVDYHKQSGNTTTSVQGEISEFHRDRFIVSVLGIESTFVINEPPHQVDGVWKMKIDGIEIVRQ